MTLNCYITELERFFEPRAVDNLGCHISTSNGKFTNSHNAFTEFDGDYFSPKMKELAFGGMEAVKAIEEGEVILKEKAVILCKHPPCVCSNSHYFECAYCTRSIDRFFVCHDCDITIYCSEQCRYLAYREYHAFECRAVKCHFFGNKDILWIAFRMLMLGTLYKFDTTTPSKYQYMCTISDCKKNVNQLKVLRGTTAILVYLKNYTNYFTSAGICECFPNLTINERVLKVGGILFRHVLQAHNSAMYFPNEMVSLTTNTNGVVFGTPALCIGATKFIYACTPNTAIVFVNNYYYIKALREIKANENLTINCVHLDERFYGRNNKFKCTCVHCVSTEYMGRLYICYNCNQNMLELWHTEVGCVWKCQNCKIFESNPSMESKVSGLATLLKKVKQMDARTYQKNGYVCKVYMEFYDTLCNDLYPEYLYVLEKAFALSVANLDIDKSRMYACMLFESLPKCLNKYSFQKLDILTSMVNCVLITIFMKEIRLRRIIKMARTAMLHLAPLCTFYMLEQQFIELSNVLNYIEQKYLISEKNDINIVEDSDMLQDLALEFKLDNISVLLKNLL